MITVRAKTKPGGNIGFPDGRPRVGGKLEAIVRFVSFSLKIGRSRKHRIKLLKTNTTNW